MKHLKHLNFLHRPELALNHCKYPRVSKNRRLFYFLCPKVFNLDLVNKLGPNTRICLIGSYSTQPDTRRFVTRSVFAMPTYDALNLSIPNKGFNSQ